LEENRFLKLSKRVYLRNSPSLSLSLSIRDAFSFVAPIIIVHLERKEIHFLKILLPVWIRLFQIPTFTFYVFYIVALHVYIYIYIYICLIFIT